MSDKVKVAVRVRPLNSREIDLATSVVVDMDETQAFLTHPTAKDRKENMKTFTYDHCFWSMDENDKKFASQEKVYRCLGTDVLTNAFKGYNACLFAYGQTGSGKSYTMMGSSTQTGIIPRLCDDLFERISNNKDENTSFKVEVSYIEIYNEKVRDLLNPRGGKQTLKVREHKVTGPYVDGLTKLVVSSFQDIDSLMIEGNKSRTVAATNMNSESSRSHAVFNIVLTQAEFDEETQTTGEKASKLSLVDLAGSERASKTGTTGDRLREGSNINKSLHTLGLVISALADQASGKAKKGFFVPYRDSVLTWLLKDNLGGNSKTVMVATISPAADNYEETMSTLRYADRAKRIVNHAVVNEDPNAKIIRELREEVERLKQILKIKGFSDSKDEIKEKLTESENLMEEFTMSWEEKEKNTEKIKQERHKALEEMGISIQSSGIAVEKSKFYLVNLNADPSLNELLVYYLKERTVVGRHDAVLHTDIQLQGLGILPEHCTVEIIDNEVFVTPMPNARTCRNGVVITEKTVLHHGDRILWGNNHFFRINCPRPPGAVNEPEPLVDYEFAQREICMNDRSSDISEDALAVLEEKHKIDKEEALVKQRQMYEEKIERMRYEMSPAFRPERTVSLGSFSSSGISSSRLSVNDDLDNLENERSLEKLKEEVIHANALVREANQLSEEMKRDTEFAVTLQIPTSGLSLNRSRAACASEVAIVVKHKNRGTQFWSLDKLSNKIYDMRDTYNQIEEGNSTKIDEDDDLFFEVECHTLIGVANVYLECIFLDVPLDYAAPVISQQGEVCGRLKVEITRALEDGGKEADAGSLSDDENPNATGSNENGEHLGITDHDEEISVGQTIAVKVKIIEAYDLPLAYCNYVFCQYEFWDQPNVVELSSPGSKSNSVVFSEEQVFHFEATEEFLEYISDGALSIEIWGNRSKGFGQTSWTPNIEPIATNSEDGWNNLKRKVDLWTEIHELNDQGVFCPVEVNSRNDNTTGGIFQLRQGQSRRIVVGVRPLPKSGSLPVVIETISAIEVGSVCRRDKNEEALDSYQDKDLSILRDKLSNSLMRKREYLDEQIQLIMHKKEKSAQDKERESWLIDQWVNLTEERNFLLHPEPGSNVPGSPSNRGITPGMEKHVPVIFLDLNAEGIHNTSVDQSSVGGLESCLPFESDNKMKELPTIKYNQKNVCIIVSWDSSVHDSPYLNRATSSSERVYLIIKAHVRLSSPLAMDLILRKRICVRIYKRQSLKESLMRKIWKDNRTRCCVTYELVSHIPRQPGEETEERGNLAEKAAEAVSKNDEEHEIVLEKYHRGISHVEGLLKLDKLRQEVVVKEKLAASGKPLRKFASTPNLLQGSFDLSSIGSKNDSLDIDYGLSSFRKGSPGQQMHHVTVSFDDWDNPSTSQDTNLLTPTFGSSTPTNALETVLEQSAPSSPVPIVMVTETSFPYTPEETSPGVARSLESDFDEERKTVIAQEEKEPLVKISNEDDNVLIDPEGIIPTSNKLVEFPIEFENSNEGNMDLSASKLSQNDVKLESDLATKLDLLDSEVGPNLLQRKSDLATPISPDVVKIGNIRPVVEEWSDSIGDANSLSNSVDSGLHESTDQLLDTREVGQRDAEEIHVSTGRGSTRRDSEGELRIGQVIAVGDSKVGFIRYIGKTEFASGEWVGVELELPVGKNDGSVNGKRYFTCKPRYGTFVRADKVTLLNTRPKSTSSSRVIVTRQNRRISAGSPGTSSPGFRDNAGAQTRSKSREGSSSDTANSKEMNRRSNISF